MIRHGLHSAVRRSSRGNRRGTSLILEQNRKEASLILGHLRSAWRMFLLSFATAGACRPSRKTWEFMDAMASPPAGGAGDAIPGAIDPPGRRLVRPRWTTPEHN